MGQIFNHGEFLGAGTIIPARSLPSHSPRFTVHGLETRKTYLFRVKSVSHAGNSDYSKESEAILVKAALRKDSSHSVAAIASQMNKSYAPPYAQGQKLERGCGVAESWESLTPAGPYSDAVEHTNIKSTIFICT